MDNWSGKNNGCMNQQFLHKSQVNKTVDDETKDDERDESGEGQGHGPSVLIAAFSHILLLHLAFQPL